MAISEDLRSVRAALDELPEVSSDTLLLMRLVCSNLLSLAEQVELLENIPLATTELVRQPLQQGLQGYSNLTQ